jgi:hypothetical protein
MNGCFGHLRTLRDGQFQFRVVGYLPGTGDQATITHDLRAGVAQAYTASAYRGRTRLVMPNECSRAPIFRASACAALRIQAEIITTGLGAGRSDDSNHQPMVNRQSIAIQNVTLFIFQQSNGR